MEDRLKMLAWFFHLLALGSLYTGSLSQPYSLSISIFCSDTTNSKFLP